MKICSICKIEKPFTEFYSNGKQPSGKQKYKPYCKPCEMAKRQRDHINKILSVIDENHFYCTKCGYDKNISAIEFHHIEPEHKDVNIGLLKRYSIDKYKKELSKCIMLCANCHRETHNPQYNQKEYLGE